MNSLSMNNISHANAQAEPNMPAKAVGSDKELEPSTQSVVEGPLNVL